MDEIQNRLRRIYASIGVAMECDMRKFPPKIVQNEHVICVSQDFRGGMSDADVENAAYTIIHNVANLRDHLRKWAKANSKEQAKVYAAIDASPALKVIEDLSNIDKHGYGSRNDSSGMGPKLVDIRRELRLQTQAKKDSFVALTIGLTGPRVTGDGLAVVRISADVVDKNGARLGDLLQIEQDALDAWEKLLREFGIVP
ncbi:MAG TPA: hypothetical protein VGP72_05695 [Planctomycetota bacterium]|jgi:hypothetical protein